MNPGETRTAPARPAEPSLRDSPEMYRSVYSSGHPFAGLLGGGPEPSGLPSDTVRGKPLALYELLDGDRSPARRRVLLHAYWELTGALVGYKLSLLKEDRIRTWHQLYEKEGASSRDPYFQKQLPLLEAALKSATRERTVAEWKFTKKQYELLLLRDPNVLTPELSSRGVHPVVVRGRNTGTIRTVAHTDGPVTGEGAPGSQEAETLPIPTDYPLAGIYLTRIDEMRGASQEARRLDRMIAIQYELQKSYHANAAAAMEYLSAVTKLETDSTMFNSLAALDRLLEAQREMVDSVVDYNKLIADYTSETIGGAIGLYPLLTALIKLPEPENTTPAP